MKFIGITGGVGAGKSAVLSYLRERDDSRVMLADEIAHELMRPGKICYNRIRQEFRKDSVWNSDGSLDAKSLAKVIFSNDAKRKLLNGIVHPAVKEYVIAQYEKEKERGKLSYLFLEAALLIEEGYDTICDELWYIYASEETRRKRLKDSRDYSDEKIDAIMASQMNEKAYQEKCQVQINNDESLQETYAQIEHALGRQIQMSNNTQEYVFGLDIGTRNVVGTVGYLNEDEEFIVVAQHMRQHETRSMLDGQIHDIGRVSKTIGIVKSELEKQIGTELSEVCIAAAGRVLKTVTTHIEYEYSEESLVTGEDVHTLNLLGIEKAQGILQEKNDTQYKFYCVGYSVVKYYLNDELFISIEGHKANKIGEDIIVTFLPEDVVDGLYSAVGQVGLSVANMTLEPIAAINVAIPESYRMLNLALVDVGAGTSDISVTREGSIIAYGMIPEAGDELTEILVQHYLVDFKTAEKMKLDSTVSEKVEYQDIMSITHTIPSKEIWDLLAPVVERITTQTAAKIMELNGDKTVSACFVVGGGGKVHGYTQELAKKLNLPEERVALRGEEVLQEVIFEQQEIQKDPLLVTPIGICLNYYSQKNNFIMVKFNGERIKLYDNNRLSIVDAAMQAGYPNDQLFPKRGMPITFTVNGISRIVRGDAGEPAVVMMNGEPANINTPLEPNCEIVIEPSTTGAAANYTVGQLEEYTNSTIRFQVNGQWVSCPKFVEVNGVLEPAGYELKEGDAVVTRNFYTVSQVAEFMDVIVDTDQEIFVNNRKATPETLVYENFTIDWTTIDGYAPRTYSNIASGAMGQEESLRDSIEEEPQKEEYHQEYTDEKDSYDKESINQDAAAVAARIPGLHLPNNNPQETEQEEQQETEIITTECTVNVNGEMVTLAGKEKYIFVDIFDFITFDLNAGNGRAIVTIVNGHEAQYSEVLHEGDKIELYWKEKE